MEKSESYKQFSHGEDCFLLGAYPEEPCWGEVSISDEVETMDEDGEMDFYLVHACQGHFDSYGGGDYIKEK